MAHRAPRNISEALDGGGIPEHASVDQLVWLEARHVDLATRHGNQMTSRDYWRLRWAFTIGDVLKTRRDPPAYRLRDR